MTGMEIAGGAPIRKGPYGSRTIPTSRSTASFQSSNFSSADLHGDDPLDQPLSAAMSSTRSLNSQLSGVEHPQVIIPAITIKSEFTSISKLAARKGNQIVTCLVTIELPSAGQRQRYPAPPAPTLIQEKESATPASPQSPGRKASEAWSSRKPSSSTTLTDFLAVTSPVASDPFSHIAADLRNRLVDYKTSAIESLGRIRLYDILRVRKGSFILDISVYLFQQALICVSEERKKGFQRLLSSPGGQGDYKSKGVLKLKGRIYMRHVKRIIDSTVAGELSLTISMEDESLDDFILTFSDRSSHDLWHKTLDLALQEAKGLPPARPTTPLPPRTPGSAGTSSSKLARMGMPESIISESQKSPDLNSSPAASPDPNGYNDGLPTSSTMSSLASESNTSFGAAPLAPKHTPVDLLIALSIPSASGPAASSAQLKLRLIKTSLTFLCQVLGPRDRLSIVTFAPGPNGAIRKTPFLSPGRYEGRQKLDRFIAGLHQEDGSGADSRDEIVDEFRAETGKDEHVDMVSGLNVGELRRS